MNDQNEFKEKEIVSPEFHISKVSTKEITLPTALYYLINILYFLAFLGSCPAALLSPMALATGEGLSAWLVFLLLAGVPIIIIGIMWGARYFYRKGLNKAAFQVLLVPPLLYLVFLILQAIYWELYS
jgi:hypothetical protein